MRCAWNGKGMMMMGIGPARLIGVWGSRMAILVIVIEVEGLLSHWHDSMKWDLFPLYMVVCHAGADRGGGGYD